MGKNRFKWIDFPTVVLFFLIDDSLIQNKYKIISIFLSGLLTSMNFLMKKIALLQRISESLKLLFIKKINLE